MLYLRAMSGHHDDHHHHHDHDHSELSETELRVRALESILTGTADEIGASYCLLCSTMEYPEDRSWVIFNLRPEARFSDGTPLTAQDVLFSFETFRTKGLTDFRTVFNEYVKAAEVLDPHRI